MNPIGDKIDEFIEAELKAHPEQVEHFFERVLSNYDEAIRTMTRFLLVLLGTWFLTYAIQEGWIDKLEWLGFEFKRKMTVASPFLIGILSYGMLCALAGAIVLWEAITQRLRHTLPTAWKNYLDTFLAPPTFSNVERMLEPIVERKPLSVYYSRLWFLLVSLMLYGGGLAGIAHTTYLLFRPEAETGATHWTVIAISAALGVAAWIRGVVVCNSAIVGTGGYEFAHIRGVRTLPAPEPEPPKDAPLASPAPAPPAPSSLAPSSQQPPLTVQPDAASAHIHRQGRLLDLGRAGVLIVIERKKSRRRFDGRL